jgi:hypothetical protein
MKMMFVWGNSYDKSMRFKCGVGAYIPRTGNYIFAGNLSSYARKHTGKADEEAIAMIQTQLNMANVHYAELLESRDNLIINHANLRTYSELVGRMFIEKQCLNKEQASAVRDRLIGEVALLDNTKWHNAWNFYNSVAMALRMSHPKNWFEDQAECHKLINSHFALMALTQLSPREVVQDPVHEDVQEPTNQLDIFDTIAEVEATRALTSPTDVIEDDLSLLVEEIQEEVVEEKEEFFNFDGEELPTFDLPDL